MPKGKRKVKEEEVMTINMGLYFELNGATQRALVATEKLEEDKRELDSAKKNLVEVSARVMKYAK